MKPLSHVHFTLALLAGWFTCLSIYGQEDSVLVFNELMYSPGEGGSEWVELVNLHGVDIDVSDWSLDGAVSFTFPKDTVIPGNGYVVIDGVGGGTPGALGIFDGQLDNGGESLRLLNYERDYLQK